MSRAAYLYGIATRGDRILSKRHLPAIATAQTAAAASAATRCKDGTVAQMREIPCVNFTILLISDKNFYAAAICAAPC